MVQHSDSTSWLRLGANQIGAALKVPAGDLSFVSTGDHAGGALTLLGSSDGREFHKVTSPMRGNRKGRLERGLVFVKPVVVGGSRTTSIDVVVGR